MPQTEVIAPLELIVNRTFNAPRERIFRAWTEAAELDRWFSPSLDATIKSSVDLRVGGSYRIDMSYPDGRTFSAWGAYREVRPPERLVYTWRSGELNEDTVVTVVFVEDGDKTHVTLTHQNFHSVEARDLHEAGWKGGLQHLESIL